MPVNDCLRLKLSVSYRCKIVIRSASIAKFKLYTREFHLNLRCFMLSQFTGYTLSNSNSSSRGTKSLRLKGSLRWPKTMQNCSQFSKVKARDEISITEPSQEYLMEAWL